MAEGYLAKRLRDLNINDIEVVSFGTGALPGLKPSTEAIEVMKGEGVDVSGYVSSRLDRAHINEADVILAMEPYHREQIIDLEPEAVKKTYLLGEFSMKMKGKLKKIEDPIGQPIDSYKKIFEKIKNSVDGFLKIQGLTKWTKK